MPRVILAIEDDESSREILVILLRHLGYEVLEADSYAEAIRLLTLKPDLILLDLELPDGDGWHLAHLIRTQSDTPDVPIMILSSLDQPGAMPVQVSGYFEKPLDIAALKERIAELIGPADTEPPINA
jgi:CheY-like chemotaxis protein